MIQRKCSWSIFSLCGGSGGVRVVFLIRRFNINRVVKNTQYFGAQEVLYVKFQLIILNTMFKFQFVLNAKQRENWKRP